MLLQLFAVTERIGKLVNHMLLFLGEFIRISGVDGREVAIFHVIDFVADGYSVVFVVDLVQKETVVHSKLRTAQNFLAQWSSGVDFCLWQMGVLVLGIFAVAAIVVIIVMKWNPVRWIGWALAGAALFYLLHTLVFGLNYYAGPLADDIRLEMRQYGVEELADAFYLAVTGKRIQLSKSCSYKSGGRG